MIRALNIVILVFISIPLCANEIKIQGTISDQSNKMLQYVSIGIVNKTIGTVSDINGKFELIINKRDISDKDTLRFSMIGYESKSFPLSEIIYHTDLKIQLNQKIVTIPEVIVTGKKLKTKIKGTKHFPVPLYVGVIDSTVQDFTLGSSIARSLNISHENTRIENIRFFLYSNFDTTSIRINFYSIRRRKPYKSILTEGIYTQITGKTHDWVSVDLKPYNIVVNEDIVIAIEWVGRSKNGSYLFFPLARPSAASHFYRQGCQNKWEKYPGMSCLMELTLKY